MRIAPVIGLLAVVLCGCSPSVETAPTVPVTGKVTFKGSPVAGAIVSFSPVAIGKGHYLANATTKEDGTFELTTTFGAETIKPGAVADNYKVTIVKTKQVAAATSAAAPKPEDMAKMMGEANKGRPMGGGMGMRPGMSPGGGPGGGLKDSDSEIPVQYASSTSTPLQVKVPGDKYDFDLVEKAGKK